MGSTMNSHRNHLDYRGLVDLDNGTVDRSIFSDDEIYRVELERIFARAWNFMCHESQISKPGDFFRSFIGEESVIATRDRQGHLQVLLNTCPHRGSAICRAEMGNARTFMCPYHGWTFDLAGNLVGVPGHKEFYGGELKVEEWGLRKAAKVESYKGFVFATLDPDAPPLDEYLGVVGRMGLNMAAAQGDMAVVDGVQKFRIDCNWKLAVDNVFDWYHAPATHASAAVTGFVPRRAFNDAQHVVALGEYGHAISGPRLTPEILEGLKQAGGIVPPLDESWRERPGALDELPSFIADTRGHPNVFPNLWIALSGTQICLRLPRGPGCTEMWWFTLLDNNLTDEQRAARLARTNHTFGPGGFLEQDDGENWVQSTLATHGTFARRHPFNFTMNLGRGEIKQDNSGAHYIDGVPVNEHGQLWTYGAWAEWMSAEDWNALKRDHSVPAGSL